MLCLLRYYNFFSTFCESRTNVIQPVFLFLVISYDLVICIIHIILSRSGPCLRSCLRPCAKAAPGPAPPASDLLIDLRRHIVKRLRHALRRF